MALFVLLHIKTVIIIIVSIYSYSCVNNSSNKGYWALVAAPVTNNSIYRNTFMLDPAK